MEPEDITRTKKKPSKVTAAYKTVTKENKKKVSENRWLDRGRQFIAVRHLFIYRNFWYKLEERWQ